MNRPAPWRSIMASVIDRRPFRVGGATVDPVSRDAQWNGGAERLQPQTLKVLQTLLSYRGEVVTRDDLIQLCWDGRIVGDDVINRSISLLRHFAERAGGFEIETVPRTGYRLVETGTGGFDRARRFWMLGAAPFCVALLAVAAWSWLDRVPISQGRPPTPSISVVPFTAESSDPLARQVAAAAPVSVSRMMAESGFAIMRDDTAGASGAGRSAYLFSGNVRRTAASMEATVRLVSKDSGAIIYSHDFTAPVDRAADLPDRIGAAAAAELAWTGAQMVLDPNEHLSPEIASELMQSLVLTIEGSDRLRAYQLAHHAAVVAPDSAMAQLSLTMHTGFALGIIPRGQRYEALVRARRAGDRARALAPEFGDVYLTWCQLHSPVRMTACDARVRRALEVDSRSSFVPGFLSSLLYGAGRIDEAVELASQSLANDPYKPAKLARMIRMLEVSGRSDEAERVYREAARLWPDNIGRMRSSRLFGMAERGNYAGLAAFASVAADSSMIDPPIFAALLTAQRRRDLPGARRECSASGLSDLTLSLCMTILADLGDLDRSFAIAAILYPTWHASAGEDEDRLWLDNLDGFDFALLNSPAARAMRTDARFFDMSQKLGLLDYWRSGRLPDFCTRAHEPVCARILRH